MKYVSFTKKNIYVLIPVFGSAVFILLYIIATLYYPGGSQIDKNSIGFSWFNNYWCNLLNDSAINGKINAAKPIAISAMFVLCLSLTYFWWLFPIHLQLSVKWKYTIQISGAISMIFAFGLFTSLDHDLVTNLASIFGLIATIGTFIGLYQKKWKKLFVFGLLNLLLVCLNNYLYYSTELIVYLPLIQKISFASFLIWVCSIDMKIYRL